MYGRVWREEWKERNILILSKIKLERKKEATKNIPKAESNKGGESRHNKVSSETTEQLLSLIGGVRD